MDEKRIEAAAKELVNALDRCADVINGAFQFAAIRVADYTDAVKLIYGKELDALKRALAGEGEQDRGEWMRQDDYAALERRGDALAQAIRNFTAGCDCNKCNRARKALAAYEKGKQA